MKGREGRERGAALCSNREIKNCENFVQQSSHQHLINNRRPAIAIHVEASNNIIYQ